MGARAASNSAPIVAPDEVAELLARHWGITAELSSVGSFEDLNFRVRCGDHDALLKASEQSVEVIA
ncbi:MAG: hypothetical protein M3Y09_09775, partial [Actinomycetota bacterium]|nr:hypothetical protein [Actinomycetota bacterium]